jgi:hypothetical protein
MLSDAKTIWNFREALKRAGAIEVLFARFDVQLKGAGCLAMSGQIVDASIVAAESGSGRSFQRRCSPASPLWGWPTRRSSDNSPMRSAIPIAHSTRSRLG